MAASPAQVLRAVESFVYGVTHTLVTVFDAQYTNMSYTRGDESIVICWIEDGIIYVSFDNQQHATSSAARASGWLITAITDPNHEQG